MAIHSQIQWETVNRRVNSLFSILNFQLFYAQTRKESLYQQTLFPDSSKRKIMRLYHWAAQVRPVRPQEQLRAFSPDASQ